MLKDNSRLNSRHPDFISKPQRLVILDAQGELLPKLNSMALWNARAAQDITVITKPGIINPNPEIRHLQQPLVNSQFELNQTLLSLHSLGLHSLFVEAGGITSASFLRQ